LSQRVAASESSQWVFNDISFAARKTAVELDTKSNWKTRVPWLMSEGDDPEQAAEILRQLAAADDSSLDALSLDYKKNYTEALEATHNGSFSVIVCFVCMIF
jgi:hypothetical protein